jgi:hypothetical protein
MYTVESKQASRQTIKQARAEKCRNPSELNPLHRRQSFLSCRFLYTALPLQPTRPTTSSCPKSNVHFSKVIQCHHSLSWVNHIRPRLHMPESSHPCRLETKALRYILKTWANPKKKNADKKQKTNQRKFFPSVCGGMLEDKSLLHINNSSTADQHNISKSSDSNHDPAS